MIEKSFPVSAKVLFGNLKYNPVLNTILGLKLAPPVTWYVGLFAALVCVALANTTD